MKRFLRRFWRAVRPYNPQTVCAWWCELVAANWCWLRMCVAVRMADAWRVLSMPLRWPIGGRDA